MTEKFSENFWTWYIQLSLENLQLFPWHCSLIATVYSLKQSKEQNLHPSCERKDKFSISHRLFRTLHYLHGNFLNSQFNSKLKLFFKCLIFPGPAPSSWSFSLFYFFGPNIDECSIPHCPHIKFHLAILSGRENNFHLFLFCAITKSFFQTQNWFIKL